MDWEELKQNWSSKRDRANNPLFFNYKFSTENPYLNATIPEIHQAMGSQNLVEALLAHEANVQYNVDDAEAWYKLGIKQQENEREASAISALKLAIKLKPETAQPYLAIAVSYTNESCYMDAYDALVNFLRFNSDYSHLIPPNLPSPTTQDELHNFCFDLYLKAVRENTGSLDPDVQIGLGVILNISEDYGKAIDCFRSALSAKPEVIPS